jgi:cAMP phosphodiesterase
MPAKGFSLKLSDSLFAKLEDNAQATSRKKTHVIVEAIEQYLMRNPVSRDSLFGSVVSPYLGQVRALEAQVAEQNDRLVQLEQANLMYFQGKQ